MAVQIRGTQIQAATIAADRFVSGLNLATSQLAEGGLFLKKSSFGGALSEVLNMGNQKIIALADPTANTDAANKGYVDTSVSTLSNSVFKKDGSVTATGNFNLGNNRITGLAEPVAASDAATKNYVDLAIQGLSPKIAARAATTANVSLSGTQTIDGVALSAGDRILVKNQNTASENGLYIVSASSWVRTDDANTAAEIKGAFTFVQEGSTWADTGWVLSNDGAITLGTTGLTWVQFSSAGQISAGNGLTKSGNVLSVLTPPLSGLSVDSSGVQVSLDGSTLTKTLAGLKISDLGSGKILVGNSSGAAVPVTVGGDASLDSSGNLTLRNVLRPSSAVYGEVPSGTINGSNATFTLASTPLSGSEQVFYNGSRLVRGSSEDYTISGATITMVSYIPSSGDKLIVDYLK